MHYKICVACKQELPATTEFFHVEKRCKYGVRTKCKKCLAAEFKLKYQPIPKKTEKVCGHCKETFPLTSEYFYTKTTKAGTIVKKGCPPISKDSISFRSVCKICNTKQGFIRDRKKLMIKYNVSSEKELDEIIYNMRRKSGILGTHANLNIPSKRRKYEYPINASIAEMQRIRLIRDKGFDPETYHTEWKKVWLQKQKANRKYDYPEDLDIIPRAMVQKQVSLNLTDAFIANRLGFKVSEVPQDIIELKRKQLKLYRDVKNKKNQNK
jgi:hypothetical protein